LRELHVADAFIGNREIALPFHVVRVRSGEAVCNGEAVGKEFLRATKIPTHDLDIAEADQSPKSVIRLIAGRRERQYALQLRFRFVEIAIIFEDQAKINRAFEIIRIELQRFTIGFDCLLGIFQGRDRAEGAIGDRCVLAILLNPRGLFLRHRLQRLHRLGDLILLQQVEGLFEAQITLGRALDDVADGFADCSLRAWSCIRISFQQQFGQDGDLVVFHLKLVDQRLLNLLKMLSRRSDCHWLMERSISSYGDAQPPADGRAAASPPALPVFSSGFLRRAKNLAPIQARTAPTMPPSHFSVSRVSASFKIGQSRSKKAQICAGSESQKNIEAAALSKNEF
jgi:hypothetical protein